MPISQGYRQLAAVFEALEKSKFKADEDFGANVVGCFCWYISPAGVAFLEKIALPAWLGLKENSQFKWNFQNWDGYQGQGVDIRLNLNA